MRISFARDGGTTQELWPLVGYAVNIQSKFHFRAIFKQLLIELQRDFVGSSLSNRDAHSIRMFRSDHITHYGPRVVMRYVYSLKFVFNLLTGF
jgi:hypothetical protein